MRINYAKLDPTGNTTLLVSTPVPRERHGAVAAALLERLGGEQVGYIEAATCPDAVRRLQMMGGEFCGNATMALGAYLCRQRGATSLEALLEVSGLDAPVPCRVAYSPTCDRWTGTVRMPAPTRVAPREIDTDAGPLAVPLVEMPGIAHLLIPAGAGLSEAQLRRRLPQWNAKIGADAIGALTWDEAANRIDPLVYVPASGTMVLERSCGSGSAAVACWLAHREHADVERSILQPGGGAITASAAATGDGALEVHITGTVALVDEGEIDL